MASVHPHGARQCIGAEESADADTTASECRVSIGADWIACRRRKRQAFEEVEWTSSGEVADRELVPGQFRPMPLCIRGQTTVEIRRICPCAADGSRQPLGG